MESSEKARVAQITLAGGDTEELLVLPMGSNLYRLEESSLLGELQYHDIIEVEILPGGDLRLLRVTTPSELKTLSCFLPESAFEVPALKALLDRVMTIGGNWERTFGGMLTLHLPPLEEGSIVNDMNAFITTLSEQCTTVSSLNYFPAHGTTTAP